MTNTKTTNGNGIELYDVVRITALHRTFHPEDSLFGGRRLPTMGDVAVVVEIYDDPELGYELESVNEDGRTNWLVSVSASDLELEKIRR